MSEARALIADLMRDLEDTVTETQRVRLTVRDKLVAALDSTTLNPNEDKPMVTQAKLQVFTTVAGLLNDMDRSSNTRINTRLKQTELETDAKHGAQVVEIFKRFSQLKTTNGPGESLVPTDLTAVNSQLESVFREQGGAILDTETRVDPADLS